MSLLPKRPSSLPRPSVPAPAGLPSTRPSTIREATTEAHAFGEGVVPRPSAVPARSIGRRTILLVDPDANHRAQMRALLELDYDVVEASDGLEAVELTTAMQPPAMIVSETVLPRVDGFTLAKIVRNSPVLRRVPIMFVSTQDTPQHVTQALVIGVSQYLPKTTPVAQIIEKIRKIVH